MGGGGVGFELRNAIMYVLEGDKSAASRELLSRFTAPYYLLHGTDGKLGTGIRLLDCGDMMITMDVPTDFEKSLLRGKPAAVHP